MNKLFFIFLLYLPVIFLSAQDIPAPPNPPRLVNDFANVLNDGEEQQLESKLVAYNDSTSTQITVVTVRNIGGYDVMDFAYRIGEEWGVGQKGKNNGLVVLVSIDDRKAGIATGYGMEGSITDLATRRIRENYMNPNFRNGDFYKGIDEATTAIMKLASGEFTADEMGRPEGGGAGALIFLLIVIILFIVIIVSAAKRSQHNHYGTKKLDFWTALWIMMNVGGGGRGRGGNSGWGGGGSGGFGGGGGFGGFGGGGFGGGGSGGSW